MLEKYIELRDCLRRVLFYVDDNLISIILPILKELNIKGDPIVLDKVNDKIGFCIEFSSLDSC
jgi:hypothetical protein